MRLMLRLYWSPMDFKILPQEESCIRILKHFQEVIIRYTNSNYKTFALSHVPVNYINQNVDIRIRESFKSSCHPFVMEVIYLKELVSWFKNVFFRWMEIPKCGQCLEKMKYSKTMRYESVNSYSSTVEVYLCPSCGESEFLNRYVDPRVLFKTREGRCAEFSLCFTLICLSLGMRARYVVDLTDHCWTEVYSPYRHYWIHVDPSEGIVDQPLLYESGWNKKLSYVFSIGETDVQDVTWRYSSNHKAILSRRDISTNHCIKEICAMRYKLLKELPAVLVMNEFLLVIEELAALLIESQPNGIYGGRISGVS